VACLVVGSACSGASASSGGAQSGGHHTTAEVKQAGPCHGDRPILFLQGAVCSDGTAVPSDVTTAGAGNTWSPSGDRQAFVTANAKTLKLRDLTGTERVLYRAPKKVSLVHRTAWSPDGSTVAVLMLDASRFRGGIILGSNLPAYQPSLALIDTRSGHLRRRIPLSRDIVNMPFITNPPDALAFSPDGTQVLVSWDSPAVVDIGRRRVHRLRDGPAVAAWVAPGRVVFLDVLGRQRFGALHSWTAGGGDHIVLSSASVAKAGIVAEHGLEYGQIRLSPDGRTIAIRTTQQGRTGFLIAPWSDGRIGDGARLELTSGDVWDFDWSPDGSRIAAIVVDGTTAQVSVLRTENGTWATVSTLGISIEGPDTIDGLGPIKKISWSS
jgi:WD40 repeat protein